METKNETVVIPSDTMEETLDHFICGKENPGKVSRFDYPVKAICGTVLTEMPKFGGKPIKCVVCETMYPEHIEHMRR